MDRVELLVAGFSLPPLGTAEASVISKFMVLNRYRRIIQTKLLAQASLPIDDVSKVNRLLRDYVDAELRTSDMYENTDRALMDEYELVKQMQLVAKTDRDGSLTVTDLSGIIKEYYSHGDE